MKINFAAFNAFIHSRFGSHSNPDVRNTGRSSSNDLSRAYSRSAQSLNTEPARFQFRFLNSVRALFSRQSSLPSDVTSNASVSLPMSAPTSSANSPLPYETPTISVSPESESLPGFPLRDLSPNVQVKPLHFQFEYAHIPAFPAAQTPEFPVEQTPDSRGFVTNLTYDAVDGNTTSRVVHPSVAQQVKISSKVNFAGDENFHQATNRHARVAINVCYAGNETLSRENSRANLRQVAPVQEEPLYATLNTGSKLYGNRIARSPEEYVPSARVKALRETEHFNRTYFDELLTVDQKEIAETTKHVILKTRAEWEKEDFETLGGLLTQYVTPPVIEKFSPKASFATVEDAYKASKSVANIGQKAVVTDSKE